MFTKKLGIGMVSMLVGLGVGLPAVQAQQLEEIVVTAQRREQSLQEVPISIEAYTGADIRKQGYRDLETLSSMIPGIIASPQQDQTVIMIRGFGTTGNALTLEQATPIFLDGVHFGRGDQAKNAYLDVERIEILKGPQPVFFGNNATAGAFSITSKKPTPEWEGNADFELGNNNTKKINFGVGGPITDTLGIRVAGKYQTTEGYLIDLIDQHKFPHQDDGGGRITLQWTPNEDLTITAKYEAGKINAGSEGKLLCLTGDSLVYGRNGPLAPGATGVLGTVGEPFSVYAQPPLGEGTVIPHLPLPTTDGGDCFKSNVTRSDEGPYFDVPTNIRQTTANVGMLDIRKVGQAFLNDDNDPLMGPTDAFNTILGGEHITNQNSYLDFVYGFDNGVEANWLTAYSGFNRETSEENFDSPYFENNQIRHIAFDQWSTELRFTSPTGGMFEWMTGFFVQDTTLDNVTGNLRANLLTGIRMNNVWEDVRWKTAFSTVTFNFMDNKAAIDLGGRYASIDKNTFAGGYGRQWVINGAPVTTGLSATEIAAIIPVTDPKTVDVYLPYDAAAGLYTTRWNVIRTTPSNWNGTTGANVVGVTKPVYSCIKRKADGTIDSALCPVSTQGPQFGDFGSNQFDPQVVLRYAPTENHSMFARWAQSFKLGGFDTGQTSIDSNYNNFSFNNEYSETYELGSKGKLLDSQARYELTFFQTEFRDLQLQAATGNVNDPNANINAGAQLVKGVEFSLDYAATDRLTLSVAGALMDAVMKDFQGAPCNAAERLRDDLGCDKDGTLGSDGLPNGTIDRSGEKAPYTPDWSFTYEADYTLPVMDRYEMTFNARGFLSDGFFTSSTDFSQDVVWDRHGDISLSVGFGDAEGVWRVAAWGRNLLEPTQKFHKEFNYDKTGAILWDVSPSNFRTYGLKFEYNYH